MPLWERFNTDENLLFKAQDFAQPSQSLLFRELSMLRHPDAKALVGHLVLATQMPLEEVPLIDELVQDGQVRRLTADQVEQVYALLRSEGPIAVPTAGSNPTAASPATASAARSVEPSVASPPSARPVPAAVPVADAPPPNRRNFAVAALLGIGRLLLSIVHGIDWVLATCAGQGNALLHNYFRAIFLVVVLVGVPWMIKIATPFAQAQLERARVAWQLAARQALEKELSDAEAAWTNRTDESDLALLEQYAPQFVAAAQSQAESISRRLVM